MPRRTSLLAVIVTTLFWAVRPCLAQQYGVRPDGRPVPSLGGAGTKAVALFFVATDCPISNRTFPEMKRLREQFTARGIRFWYVYPNAGETSAQIQQHQAAFDAGGEALLDPSEALVRMTGAHVTPELAVLIPGGDGGIGRRVYVGRIDDRYLRIGQERPQATEHFGDRVLTEVLNGTPVEAATGLPVGCAIISHAAGSSR